MRIHKHPAATHLPRSLFEISLSSSVPPSLRIIPIKYMDLRFPQTTRIFLWCYFYFKFSIGFGTSPVLWSHLCHRSPQVHYLLVSISFPLDFSFRILMTLCTLVALHSLLPFTDSDATATTAIVTSAATSTPASGKCLHKAFRNVVIGICLFTMGMNAVYFHSPFEKKNSLVSVSTI